MLKISIPFNATPSDFERAREILLVAEMGLRSAAMLSVAGKEVVGVVTRLTVGVEAPTNGMTFVDPDNQKLTLRQSANTYANAVTQFPADDDGAPAPIPLHGVALDKTGLPYDARIHATPPTVGKVSGEWRRKRGVADALVATVEAELRATTGTNEFGVVRPWPPVPPVPAAPTEVPPPPMNAATEVPPPPAAPVSVPNPAPAPTTAASGFVGFMQRVAPLIQDKSLSHPQITAAIQAVGLNNLPDLALPQNATMVAVVENLLRSQGHAIP